MEISLIIKGLQIIYCTGGPEEKHLDQGNIFFYLPPF